MTNNQEREARYAEAIRGELWRKDEAGNLCGDVARAVIAVAGAEQADLRAEVEEWRARSEGWRRDYLRQLQRTIHREKERNAAEAELAALRGRIEALADREPMIVSGIRSDLHRSPHGRGGEIHHLPATSGRGKSGCPGDNLTAWLDDLHAALAVAPAEGTTPAAPHAEDGAYDWTCPGCGWHTRDVRLENHTCPAPVADPSGDTEGGMA